MTKPNCTVPECPKPARSMTSPHCEMHYWRLRRSGTLNAKPWHVLTTCTVPDCGRPERGNALCEMHFMRDLRHSDPMVTYRPRQVGECTIDGCAEPKESHGWCKMHARRARHNGDPLVVKQGKPQMGELHHNWVGDDVTYGAWHDRIRAARGRAALYPCADCGNAAADWSYDHTGVIEKQSDSGPYALDLDCYQPRCSRCHMALDGTRGVSGTWLRRD